MFEGNVRERGAGGAEATPSMLAQFAGPIRWVGNGIWGLAAFVLIVGAVVIFLSGEELNIGLIITAAVLVGIGWLFRYAARRLEDGDGAEMPVVASYTFMAAGAAMVIGGIALVIDDPGGFALIAFGLVFIGAGYLARRLFATPAGKKAVQVSAHEVGIRTFDGRRGSRRQASIIHLDEDATEAEIEAAKAAWLDEQWRQRPDWAAGRIVAEDARSANWLYIGAGLWTVLASGALVAALFWGDIAWLGAAFTGIFAVAFWGLAVRASLRRRKYGASHLVLDRTPAVLGERLTGKVESGVPKATVPRDGFQVRLQCVHRWKESSHHGASGSERRTHRRREVLWQDERREPGHITARSPSFEVAVKFSLPAEQPATTLGGSRDGITWELVVSAAMPGLDYAASFELPVLTPDLTSDTVRKVVQER
jgi:hypothetical protein